MTPPPIYQPFIIYRSVVGSVPLAALAGPGRGFSRSPAGDGHAIARRRWRGHWPSLASAARVAHGSQWPSVGDRGAESPGGAGRTVDLRVAGVALINEIWIQKQSVLASQEYVSVNSN